MDGLGELRTSKLTELDTCPTGQSLFMGGKNPCVLSPTFSKANMHPVLPQSLTVLLAKGSNLPLRSSLEKPTFLVPI